MSAAPDAPAPDAPVPDGPALVPLHPEAVPGEPLELRWVVPPSTLGFVGPVRSLPEPMHRLVEAGVVAQVVVEPVAVRVRLAEARTWRESGPAVRDALQAALADPRRWVPSTPASADDVLLAAAREVIAGEVGEYARSHGGEIRLVGAHDGRVEVELDGACSHCPAADLTLTGRFETALRSRYPGLRSVSAGGPDAPVGSRRLLDLRPLRRG